MSSDTTTQSALHRAALAYAKDGIPVFPCLPDSKVPATPHGFKEATTDRETIDRWWYATPAANIAFSPHDVDTGVVDIDSPEAEAAWNELAKNDPPTYSVRTPRAGLHIYYLGELPTSVGRLIPGEKIDTRGRGSYALLPPSRTPNGAYVVESEADVQPLPDWVAPLLANMHKGAPVAGPEGDLDLPVNIGRAKKWLLDREPAKEGSMGNQWTYDTAAGMHDFGLSPGTVLELMAGEWNDRCEPPWSNDELEEIVEHATRYRQNEGAQHAARDMGVVYARALDGIEEEAGDPDELDDAEENDRPRHKLFRPSEWASAFKTPAMLVEGILPDNALTALYGMFGSGKSFVAADMAFAVATGLPVFGRYNVKRPGPVVYMAGEGAAGLAHLRFAALAKNYGVNLADFDLLLTEEVVRLAETDAPKNWIADIRGVLAGKAPVLIINDTKARSMEGADSNAEAATMLHYSQLETIRKTFRCAVIDVMHVGKDEAKGILGSIANYNAVDWTLCTEKPGDPLKPTPLTVTMMQVGKVKDETGERENTVWLKARAVPLTVNDKGNPVGSLVLHPVTEEVFDAAVTKLAGREKPDPANDHEEQQIRRQVMTVLREAGIFGSAKQLTRGNMAKLLAGDPADCDPDEYDEAVAKWDLVLKNGCQERRKKEAKLAGCFHRVPKNRDLPDLGIKIVWYRSPDLEPWERCYSAEGLDDLL